MKKKWLKIGITSDPYAAGPVVINFRIPGPRPGLDSHFFRVPGPGADLDYSKYRGRAGFDLKFIWAGAEVKP